MNILFVTNEIPYPPTNGVRIAVYYPMLLMREAGHRLALAVLSNGKDAISERLKHMGRLCEEVLHWQIEPRSSLRLGCEAIFRSNLYYMERHRSPSFSQALRHQIALFSPDVVHFDTISMTQYIDYIPSELGTVASINDSWALTLKNSLRSGYYTGLKLWYRKMEYLATRRYESIAYAKFCVVHTMTEVDASYLRGLNPNIRVISIPNGVDSNLISLSGVEKSCKDIIFVAKLSGANLLCLERFLKESWPIVRKDVEDAQFHVVGEVTEEALSIKKLSEKYGNVRWHGFVPELADAYRKCGIAVIPVDKNVGIVNKALEAMAAGLAVVGFNSVFKAIKEAKPFIHFMGVDNYLSLGQAIVDLILKTERRHAIQIAASNLMRKHYSWESRLAMFNQMYMYASKRESIEDLNQI